ncbi:MAG TPA: hypothetical protein VGL39_17590 [Jatrophihabitantaceae bacterium]
MSSAFDGVVSATAVSTSPIGNPLCVFTLRTSDVGAGGTVSMSLDAKASARSFGQVKGQTKGATTVDGLGQDGFYVNDDSTMRFLSGSTSVVVQATMKLRAGTQYAKQIRADVLAVSKAIAAQI